MRMIFSRQLGVTPKFYRERFRAEDVPNIPALANPRKKVVRPVPDTQDRV
jgi:hypothetical protein